VGVDGPSVAVRVDVHAHYLPPFYRDALVEHGHGQPDGFPFVPEWSAAEHVAVMDRLGIARSVLSVSSPGVRFGDVYLARAVNDEGRKAVVDHPARFGLLASLPLPDVDASLAEIDRACDELDADGFVLLTNIAGCYVSDAAFSPVIAELGRRGRPVLLHPTSPACWEHTSLGRPRPMVEFLFDTTRTVLDLVLNGTIAAHPGLRLIVPHAGAVLPLLADRVTAFAALLEPDVDVLGELARLHYDLAGHALPRGLGALRTIADPEHLHYGSDWPFTPESVVAAAAARLDVEDLPLRTNTERLFERTPA
jgi:predicted TIM-barrel fold metal-dependent hydrolase